MPCNSNIIHIFQCKADAAFLIVGLKSSENIHGKALPEALFICWEETNPKNVIVNTNTIDEMMICEETGLKYVMPSATTLTKNPVKPNKKVKARNQLEIDEETGLKTTIEKNKTGNSKITNNSNEPSRTLESTADNSLAKDIPAKSQKEHEGKNEAQRNEKPKNKENIPT